MNNDKSIDNDVLKISNGELVNNPLSGSSKYQHHINPKMLSFIKLTKRHFYIVTFPFFHIFCGLK